MADGASLGGCLRWNRPRSPASLSLLVKAPGQGRLSTRRDQRVQFETLGKTAPAVTFLRHEHQVGFSISSAFNNNRNLVKNNPIKRQSGRAAVAVRRRRASW
jgi:hypothetical protein